MKKILTIVVLAITMFSSGWAQSCDTLFNLSSQVDTQTLIPSGLGGFISGNNGYGDLAVAEGYAVPGTGYYLTSATLYFGDITINPTDTNSVVTIYVWDNTDTLPAGNMAPGDAIDSAQVTLGEIALAISESKGLQVHFTSTSELATDSAYVGIIFPTTEGDSIALYTNTPNGTGGNGWVLSLDPSQDGAYTWISYNNDYQFGATGSLGNFIQVTMCNAPNPSPAANFTGSASSNCNPSTVTLTDLSGPPSPTYIAWVFGDGNTGNGSNATNTYLAAGTYSVTEFVANDTGSVVIAFVNSVSPPLTLLPSPVVTPTITPSTDNAADASAFVTVVSPTGHYFISWIDSGTVIETASDTLSDVFNGVYVVQVEDQNGCIVSDSIYIEPSTGILNLSPTQQLQVYPNPATDELNLVWSQKSNAEVSVVDLTGKVLITIITNGDMKTIYDIRNLASGDYILRVTDKTNNAQQSLLFTKLR